ncbi:MAG: Trk system potassium transporter TrkA [Magnetococcales bacterium]|nr:Trk system potassium transporter TrkA [Magnetococcales bacterium]
MSEQRMRVVIFGAGMVGSALGQHIIEQGHDICFVESNSNTVRAIRERMDVQIVHGTAENTSALKEADIESADMILVVTNQDKTNIILTLIARSFNPKARIIARIKDVEFLDNRQLWKTGTLADTIIISPERAVVETALHILTIQQAFDVVEFLGGKVRIAGFRLEEDNMISGKPLREVAHLFPSRHVLMVGVERNGEVFIPAGDSVLMVGDRVFLTVPEGLNIPDIMALLGKSYRKDPKFVILGGGQIGMSIARQLEKRGKQAVVIESDHQRCQELAESLSATVVLNGDVTDADLLGRAITSDTILLAVTPSQELNFFISLLARKRGAMQVVTMMDNEAYIGMAPELGVDAILSPRLAAVGTILRFARMGRILDSAVLLSGRLNLFLVEVDRGARLDGMPLREANFPRGLLMVAAVQDKQIIVPSGDLVLKAGDMALFVTLGDSQSTLMEQFITARDR